MRWRHTPPDSAGVPSLNLLLPDFSTAQTLDTGCGEGRVAEGKEAQILNASQIDGTKSWNPEAGPPLTPYKAMGCRLHPGGPP